MLLYLSQELSGASSSGLKADLKAAIGHSGTASEWFPDRFYSEALGELATEAHLYGLMLSILSKNMAVFRYLYEEADI